MSAYPLAPRDDGPDYNPIANHLRHTRSASVKTRLRRLLEYLDDEGAEWYEVDMGDFRDSLLDTLSARSAKAYLSTVRSVYKRLLRDNQTRDFFYSLTPPSASAVQKKAFVDEMIVRLENATDPATSRVKETRVQDRNDHLWLTAAQAQALVEAPGTATLRGLRDTAMFALLLCTGVRVAEVCAIEVGDLRHRLGRELALLVRHGKGDRQRLVVYGAMDWCLDCVDEWLEAANISKGPVLRGISDGYIQRVGDEAMVTNTVRYALRDYPITLPDGELVAVTPHDLRRTYARLQYESGMDLVALQQNLGHMHHDTTIGYIGNLDAAKRRAKAVFRPRRGG